MCLASFNALYYSLQITIEPNESMLDNFVKVGKTLMKPVYGVLVTILCFLPLSRKTKVYCILSLLSVIPISPQYTLVCFPIETNP